MDTDLRTMSNAEFLAGMVAAGIMQPMGDNLTDADIAEAVAAIEPFRLYLADKMDAAKPAIDAAEAKRRRKAAKRMKDAGLVLCMSCSVTNSQSGWQEETVNGRTLIFCPHCHEGQQP